jgi:isopenicillin N synthase-like dioxygenase
MRAEGLAAFPQRAPPPILRITHYPGRSGLEIVTHPYTDIDPVTLLPRATAPGLQVASDDGWHEIQIDEESVIVLAGEMLGLMGGPSAEVHRVVGDHERLSVSFFVNASPNEPLPDGKIAGAVLEQRLRMVRRACD